MILRRAIAFLAVAAVTVTVGVHPASAEQSTTGDDDGLALDVATAYTLDLAGGAVDVSMKVSATNVLEDRSDEFGVTRFFFDEVTFLVPEEATEVRVTDGEAAIAATVTPREVGGVAELTVPLAPRLYSQETASFQVDFTLPAAAPRSDGDIRVNPAFAWFFVWAYGDPGSASVAVEVDPVFQVDVIGDPLVRTVDESGRRILRANRIDDPTAWVAVISARNDAALERTTVDVSGTTVTLESWPGDTEWSDTVAAVITEGVPVLEELTGFELGPELEIAQSFGPLIHGYGGWFVDGEHRIEMGEDLDERLILHEISHSWFNEELFGERWIVEGLAEAYVARAVDRLGGDRGDSERGSEPAALTPGLALNDWDAPSFDQRTVDDTDEFAYGASWRVTESIFERAGEEVMAEVLAAAANDEIAYRGEAPPEKVDASDDWRRYLDLVEELGDVSVSDLFTEWVAGPDDRILLARRDEVRARYIQLEVGAGSWALPEELRRAMGEWDFDTADRSITAAAEVLEARRQVEQSAAAIGASPPSLEGDFEAGEDPEVLMARLAAQQLAIAEVTAARAAVDRPRSLLEQAGLLWSEVDGRVEAATAAITVGDLASATETADAVQDVIASGERSGIIRIGSLTAVVLLAALTGLGLRRRRRATGDESPPVEVSQI